jgi:hypothetical protein
MFVFIHEYTIKSPAVGEVWAGPVCGVDSEIQPVSPVGVLRTKEKHMFFAVSRHEISMLDTALK